MDMEQTRRIFIEESRELLQDMEQALLDLENQPGDPELINRIFRAAHTIKGNSGMFGFDAIVSFTHVLETLLDQVRKGESTLSETLVALLFRSRDHLETMVEGAVSDPPVEAPEETREIKELLEAYAPGGQPPAVFNGCAHAPAACEGCTHRKEQAYHISVRFNRDSFRHGQDPRTFLRSLREMGTLCSVFCVSESVPPVLDPRFDPESCYLGFELELVTSADKETIGAVFEFAHEDTVLFILPPESKTAEYIAMLQKLPEDDAVIGEYLVRSGALSRSELTEGLEKQKTVGGYLGEILVESGAVRQEVVNAALNKQKQIRTQKTRESLSIRVDASKLELLINQVGELVISGANVSQLCRVSGREDLVESASEMFRLVEMLRETALSLRMVPIGETFNRFQRVVRDISKEVGKEVALVVSGGETELDKTVVEKITDPLVHLVRNAIDHGIEKPEVRAQRWKPAHGTLRLHAFHDAGTIVIQVSDDGGGLRRERILQKARERGLISSQQVLSDGEIFQLIFHPGFSTAEKVSNLSGRGVGMDVVKRNIEALRGTAEVGSEEGKGTTVTIRLPLTLAIIDGFLVKVGSGSYVVPLDMVVECVELTAEDLENSHGRDFVNLRGEILPFISLRRLFNEGSSDGTRDNIVVIQASGKKAGLVVDELLGEIQTVIKPMGKIFQGLRGISGATILGSGEVALILDVPSMVQQAVDRQAEEVGT